MTAQPKKNKYTSEEYLALERKAKEKSEYRNGQIFTRASSDINHITIMMNIAVNCHQELKDKDARVLMCDMKVATFDSRYILYPDILIYQRQAEFQNSEKDVIFNPQIIFEIVSRETSAFDRGDKFQIYQKFASLREYILVDQNFITVEQYIRLNDNYWTYKSKTNSNEIMKLETMDVSLGLKDIYDLVEFEQENNE